MKSNTTETPDENTTFNRNNPVYHSSYNSSLEAFKDGSTFPCVCVYTCEKRKRRREKKRKGDYLDYLYLESSIFPSRALTQHL